MPTHTSLQRRWWEARHLVASGTRPHTDKTSLSVLPRGRLLEQLCGQALLALVRNQGADFLTRADTRDPFPVDPFMSPDR
ncbi:hypothetical protein CBOM_01923 [Ceraceosorus bombacis]|uniref:Uncharacterized protein n=1 Tax=Ceraceosorus bombacis TaxID=401625 RepID=A0A0P1BF77_9BASI|nr:hypothetical protein CBOM_01923 [Ceraceosorus bombacis]